GEFDQVPPAQFQGLVVAASLASGHLLTQSLGERASGLSKLAGIDPIGSAQLHDHVCPPAVAGARVRHIRSFCEVSGGWRGDREMSGQTGADSRRMSSAVLVA